MYDDEVTQLRSKVKAYEIIAAQWELERREYQRRIAQLELEVRTCEGKNAIYNSPGAPLSCASTLYDDQVLSRSVPALSPTESHCSLESQPSASVKFIYHEPQTSFTGKKRGHAAPNERTVRPRQAARWIAAGYRMLENIEQSTADMDIAHLQNIEVSHPDGSPYERAKTMAKSASSTLDSATHAARTAQIQLFFFLSALRVLEQRGTLSSGEINNVMDLLEGNTNSLIHRRRILYGVKWFHETLISKLLETHWDIGHAIAVVATSRFGSPYD